MPVGLIEIQDELNVRLLGIPSSLMDEARKELTYYVPGFNHMPLFVAGRWDGKVRLLGTTGKTYLNLVPDILPTLEAAGYDMEIEDRRADWSSITDAMVYPTDQMFADHSWPDGSPIILRDYQLAAVHAALDHGQGLLEAATGSGKTLICAAISSVYANFGKVVVIVPNIDLAIQTQALFKRVGLDPGIWYGELKDARNITISTWQSLDHSPELYIGVICTIVDEAHQAKAKTLSEIMSGPACNVPFRFGCTGTVPKEEIWQQQIKGVIGSIIFQLRAWELQDLGVLATAEVYQIILMDTKNPDYTGKFEDWSDQVNWMFADRHRMRMVASVIEDAAKQEGNVLTLISYRKHGKLLQDAIPDSMSVDGDLKGGKRQIIYEEFGAGDNGNLIATFGVASTGIDIPRIHVLSFVEPGKKFEKIIQTVGRGLRKAPDKDHVIILDIAGDSSFSKTHAAERRHLYKEARIPCHVEYLEYIGAE